MKAAVATIKSKIKAYNKKNPYNIMAVAGSVVSIIVSAVLATTVFSSVIF